VSLLAPAVQLIGVAALVGLLLVFIVAATWER
jgi:hypothetical protein